MLQTTALATLVQEVLDATGMSHAELARRSGLSAQAVSTFLGDRERRTLPLPSTIHGLAKGLGIPDSLVIVAALKDVGFDLVAAADDIDTHLEIIVSAAREMTPEDRARLARIAASFAA